MIPLLLTLVFGAEPSEPQFEAHRVHGSPVTGRIQSIGAGWSAAIQGEPPTSIAHGELVSLRQLGVRLPPPPEGTHVVFANGDQLPGRAAGIIADKLRFHVELGTSGKRRTSELIIPVNRLSALWLVGPPETRPRDLQKLLTDRRRRDVIVLHNGDQRIGSIREMTDDKLKIGDGDDLREIDARHVSVIAFNTDSARSPRVREAYARVRLRNGGRLSLLSATADDKALTGRTLFGADIGIQWHQIATLDIFQGPAQYLSDLKATSYQHTPFLGVRWNYALDRSVAGGFLRLGGDYFEKGIGMHSESRLTFALDRAYRRFEAFVGLNDRDGQGGSVRIRVLIDGKDKISDNGELSSAVGPRRISVDVQGAEELAIVVEFGSGGDVRDHVDWADARLIK